MSEDNLLLLIAVFAILVTVFVRSFWIKRKKSWLTVHLSIFCIYSLFFLYLLLSAEHGEEAFVAWAYWLIVMCIHEVMLIIGGLFGVLSRFFKG